MITTSHRPIQNLNLTKTFLSANLMGKFFFLRPFSLLNVDYKIASAVLSSRIKNVLPSIISDKQKVFLKGRFFTENKDLFMTFYRRQPNKVVMDFFSY